MYHLGLSALLELNRQHPPWTTWGCLLCWNWTDIIHHVPLRVVCFAGTEQTTSTMDHLGLSALRELNRQHHPAMFHMGLCPHLTELNRQQQTTTPTTQFCSNPRNPTRQGHMKMSRVKHACVKYDTAGDKITHELMCCLWLGTYGDVCIDRSHFKVFTRVVPLFSIVMCGEFSRRSVKKTGAEVSPRSVTATLHNLPFSAWERSISVTS